MIKLERLLLATDFSESSKEAFDYAVHLARNLKTKLTLLHVFESPFFYPPEISLNAYPEVYQWVQDFREEEMRRIEALADQVRKAGIPVEFIFKEGIPFVEISKTAKEIGADLLILGTHGRKGLSHIVMGSVAERVVREAPCPVFIVRQKKAVGH